MVFFGPWPNHECTEGTSIIKREVAWLLLVASSALLIAYRVPTVLAYHKIFDVPWFIIEILITAVFIVDPFVKFAWLANVVLSSSDGMSEPGFHSM
ncbi:MAG: hypothetical protein IPP80_14460 [Ignavibacteria bacterium]|nr:hypothetical protein [Ignavibacteria bacterium]